MKLSKKDPDWNSEDFQAGVRYAIEKLYDLYDKPRHTRKWNYSCDRKFAPVELGDYLLKQARRDSGYTSKYK